MSKRLTVPKPIPIKERISVQFLQKGRIDILENRMVIVNDEGGARMIIPVGATVCLMLEPGTRISHAAVTMAARTGTLILWIGDGGVRVYSAGQPGGARSDRLLYQAYCALDKDTRLKIVRRMYTMRFNEDPPSRYSVDQLRGMEGVRVRELYKVYAERHKVNWTGRKYDPNDWTLADVPNKCISVATASLYGLTEAAILAAGYAPAIGFLHTGKPLSFVYDISDIEKFDTVVPLAFELASQIQEGGMFENELEREMRIRCRNLFRVKKTIERLIPLIEDVLSSDNIIEPNTEAMPIPFDLQDYSGDVGHRS
jgi:CRISPR-associated protein Cas1